VRVVLDSNIVVSACLTPQGASATIVELALLGYFTLCISQEVISEYREVLARPKFSRELERIKTVLEGIEETSAVIVPRQRLSALLGRGRQSFAGMCPGGQSRFSRYWESEAFSRPHG